MEISMSGVTAAKFSIGAPEGADSAMQHSLWRD
jgi:hypothetical protein